MTLPCNVLQILELRIQMRYGPDDSLGTLINEYIIDVSSEFMMILYVTVRFRMYTINFWAYFKTMTIRVHLLLVQKLHSKNLTNLLIINVLTSSVVTSC